jgi:hypothetical protein
MPYTREKPEEILFAIVLLCLGVIGTAVIYYATFWGVGFIDWDSFNYIAVARSLAEGRGFVYPVDPKTYAPLTNFPPMLSIVLAAFELVNIDAVAAARHLNAILFGLSTILVGIALKRDTRSPVFALLGAFLFLTSSTLIFYYSFALAEALYLFFTLLGFILLARYITDGKRYQLILTSVVLSLTIMTRYIGIANIFTALFVLLLYRKRGYLKTLLYLIILGVISLAPFLLWMTRSVTTDPTGDSSLNPAGIQQVEYWFTGKQHYIIMFLTIYNTFYRYFLPEKVVVGYEKEQLILVLGLIVVLITVLLYFGLRKHGDVFYNIKSLARSYPTFIIYGIYFTIYFAVIIGVTMFGKPIMVERMILPSLIAGLIIIITGLSLAWLSKNHVARIATVLFSIYLVIFSLSTSIESVPGYHNQGLGLGRKSIQRSESMLALKEFSKSKTIYSNYPWALYLHTGEIGYRINAFSPEVASANDTVIALFSYEAVHSPEFAQKYSEYLELLASGRHISVYLFKPHVPE